MAEARACEAGSDVTQQYGRLTLNLVGMTSESSAIST
jgi:hypothetical protein